MTGLAGPYLKSADLWAGLCVAALGVVGLVAGLRIFVPTGLNDSLGPRAFPVTISIMLMVLGATLAVRSVVQRRTTPPDIGALRLLRVLTLVVMGYLLVFGLLGFLLSTVLFLAALFVYLGEQRMWVAVAVAVVLAVLITVAFTSGLNVALPRGIFGF